MSPLRGHLVPQLRGHSTIYVTGKIWWGISSAGCVFTGAAASVGGRGRQPARRVGGLWKAALYKEITSGKFT